MTPAHLYWITRLDAIHAATSVVSIVMASGVALLGVVLVGSMLVTDRDDPGHDMLREDIRKSLLWLLALTLPIGGVAIFTPTLKEAAAIVVLPKIANSEAAAELGDAGTDLVRLARQYLAEKLAEKKGNAK